MASTPTSQDSKKVVERKWHIMVVDYIQEITEREFRSYDRSLNSVPSFKYLGRILTYSDNDWPVVVRNLRKAHKK